MSSAGPAADPLAPYVRVALVGLIRRPGECGGAGVVTGAAPGADVGEARWLLLHRTKPFDAWDPPGGRMEASEDLVQAVKREVEEETGLAVEVAGPSYAFLTFYQEERLLAVSMACRLAGDPDAIRLEPEAAEEWRWATVKEWQDLAAARLSSWDPKDVKKATRAVAAVWEAEEE
jgi:8-oxo-dGTP pyrophosphatase MutT (NUDIX family)